MTTQEKFRELLSLTKIYLLRSYPAGHWKIADQESFAYFRNLEKPKLAANAMNPIATPSTPKPKLQPAALNQPKPPKPPPPAPSFTFELDPINQTSAGNLSDMEKVISQHLPDVQLATELPQKDTSTLKPQQNAQIVVITSMTYPPSHQLLLANLCKAIHLCIAPAALVQLSNLPNNLEGKRIIADQHTPLDQVNADQVTPLDISQCLKDPSKKATLWNEIKKIPLVERGKET